MHNTYCVQSRAALTFYKNSPFQPHSKCFFPPFLGINVKRKQPGQILFTFPSLPRSKWKPDLDKRLNGTKLNICQMNFSVSLCSFPFLPEGSTNGGTVVAAPSLLHLLFRSPWPKTNRADLKVWEMTRCYLCRGQQRFQATQLKQHTDSHWVSL